MKNTNTIRIVAITIILLMTISCRSTKQMSSTQSTISSSLTMTMDSAAQSILNTRKTTTIITFLPMQTPAFTKPAAPNIAPGPIPAPSDIPAPIRDLAAALMGQGGGTIIITQNEQLQNDTTTVIHTTNAEQTQDESESNETESQSNPPRASPVIDKIFYIFLLLAFIIVVLQGRRNQ
ncbi:MAG: hypothetical protein J6W42_08505 [Bacteroidaceae bacterium]|nr:hypothetical protein [Bacteroidaceae bacterium]